MNPETDATAVQDTRNGFLVPWLASTVSSIVALAFVGYVGITATSLAVFVLGLLVLLAALVAACIEAGRRRAWNSVFGIIAGALTGTGLLVGWAFYIVSNMQIGGF